MPTPDDPRHDLFLRLFARSEAALHTLLRAMLPSREDAHEALQETVVVLWRKFDEFDPDRDFRAWASGIARNKALALLRDRQRDRHVFDLDLANRLADRVEAQETRHSSEREALEGCLQKLPVARRELVLSAYRQGTRMDELAAQRGQTPMSLYKILHRIRQTLHDCVRRTLKKKEPHDARLERPHPTAPFRPLFPRGNGIAPARAAQR
jgi:RNA polymerase sigma-70 factor (ECF subfamily)